MSKEVSKEVPKEVSVTKSVPSQVKSIDEGAKVKANDVVNALNISKIVWAGVRTRFGLTDDTVLTEKQLKSYVDAFLKTPAAK